MQSIDLFTDGSCEPSGGPGGWAWLARNASDVVKRDSGRETKATSNRMELLAAVEGLEALREAAKVVVHTDSKYVWMGINIWVIKWEANGWNQERSPQERQPRKKWRRKGKGKQQANREKRQSAPHPRRNQDLWERLAKQMHRHQVRSRKIKAHNGHPENEECDQMAREARQNL